MKILNNSNEYTSRADKAGSLRGKTVAHQSADRPLDAFDKARLEKGRYVDFSKTTNASSAKPSPDKT